MVTSQRLTISGLTAGRQYFFRVLSADAAGNTSVKPTSGSSTFTTTTSVGQTYSVFPSTSTPASVDNSDLNAVTLGMKFYSDVDGQVTGVRFYKGAASGTHVGTLWTATGTKLAQVTFSNESASGWQQANFATPVSIKANTTYVISYHAPVGKYAYSSRYFTSTQIDRIPLHVPGGASGVYAYGSSPAFPNQSYNNNNYWVDVVFKVQ
jgi:hypothetical protein